MSNSLAAGARRALVFQRYTGNIVDLDAHDLLDIGYQSDRQRQVMDDASEWVQRASRTLTIQATEYKAWRLLRLMYDLECDVEACVLGEEQHLFFGTESQMIQQESYAGSGDVGREAYQIKSAAKYADVETSESLISGVPWEGAETDSTNNLPEIYALKPTTYRHVGRFWGTDDPAVAPDITGAASSLSSTDPAILRFPCPIWSADVRLAINGSATGTGTLRALDWSNNVLATASLGSVLTVPDKTWRLEVELEAAGAYPQVLVDDPGQAQGVLPGEITDCGIRASSPTWA